MKKKPRTADRTEPSRAVAAVEVLEAVWLKNFELDHKVDRTTVTEDRAGGGAWVTMRVLVPNLDVELWEAGEHCDQNKDDD